MWRKMGKNGEKWQKVAKNGEKWVKWEKWGKVANDDLSIELVIYLLII